MAKMYYSEEEAADRLSVGRDELARMVEQGKLKVYADAARSVYRVDEVDALAGPEEVELTPAGEGEPITLAEADKPATTGKADTVITSEGISIFEDEDLEIESADPMAKTTIAPSVEDQVSLEGVGSGSGLLDLTRESDDTSLGAEVLDHIDAEAAISSSASMEVPVEEPYAETEPAIEVPTAVEAIDPASGAFAGLIVAAALIMLVASAVALAAMTGAVPSYVPKLQENLVVFLVVSLAVGIILAVAGFFIGKAVAIRAEALQRSGA